MAENNNGKRFGRRAACGFTVVALVTVAFYVSMFRGIELTWFAEYSKTLLFILGLIVGGLTVTDSIQNWRAGK